MPNTSPRIEDHPWGRIEWLADHSSHPGTQSSLAKMTVKPGADTPLHRHDNCSEVIHVLTGAVDFYAGDDAPRSLAEGETHVFPAYTPHRLRNTGDSEAVLMLSFSSANRQYKAVAG